MKSTNDKYYLLFVHSIQVSWCQFLMDKLPSNTSELACFKLLFEYINQETQQAWGIYYFSSVCLRKFLHSWVDNPWVHVMFWLV